jgi:ketosteroid isomerase-like protein
MPGKATDLVRHKLSGQQRLRRGLEERLVARSPWVVDVWGRLIARLSPRSRLRQLLLVRAVHTGLAAYSRGDLDLVLLAHHPNCEYRGPPDQGDLGTLELQGTSRGHQGYREFEAEWRSAWDAYWIVPQELIDLGDRYLIIVQMAGHARGSTLTVTQPAAILEELDERGMIIREQRFTDPAQALNLLGLVADDAQQRADRRGPRSRPHGN